jgi:hypothetical protein
MRALLHFVLVLAAIVASVRAEPTLKLFLCNAATQYWDVGALDCLSCVTANQQVSIRGGG